MIRRIAERILKKAIDEGHFDPSTERGKSLDFLEASNAGSEWYLSFHVLKNAGMKPVWLELDLEIRNGIEEARKNLANTARIYNVEGPIWDKAVSRFTARIEEINDLIRELNLKVPHARFQRVLIKPEREIKKITLNKQAKEISEDR